MFFNFCTDARRTGSIFCLVGGGDFPYFIYVRLSFLVLSDMVGDRGDFCDYLGEAN